jgi:voltage-dependent calcium channel T type alpha-1I
MAIDHYGMDEDLVDGLYVANMILTICFVCEMVAKMFGMGIRDYLRDGFNIFDAVIIIIGLLEYTGVGSKAITVLRTFRLLRIFKIVRSWSGLRKLLKTVLASLQSIANLALLMLLLIFIYALVGMQFFNGDFEPSEDPDDSTPRFNFNSFQYSIITIFICITAENWNGLLAAYIYKDGWAVSIFFVSLIVFGNLMLLNLFLAILLNFISENLEEDVKPLMSEEKESEDDIIEEELDYIQEKLRILAKLKSNAAGLTVNDNDEAYTQNKDTHSQAASAMQKRGSS